MEEVPDPMTGPAACIRTRSIVLIPAQQPMMDELDAALSARTWEVVTVHDAVEALTELAALERSQRSRADWGLQRTLNSALLIAQPSAWPALGDLLGAMARYFPDVRVWTFEDGRMAPLGADASSEESKRDSRHPRIDLTNAFAVRGHELADRPASTRDQDQSLDARPAPAAAKDQPMNDEAADHGVVGDERDDGAEPSPTTVTRDELDMLLETASETRSL